MCFVPLWTMPARHLWRPATVAPWRTVQQPCWVRGAAALPCALPRACATACRAVCRAESLGMGLLKATRAFQVVGQGRPPLALAKQLQRAERCVQELQQLSEAATEDWAALQEASSADSDTIIRQLRSRPPVTVEDVREVQARIAAVQRDLKAATQS